MSSKTMKERGVALIWLVLTTIVVITGVEMSLMAKSKQQESPAFQAAREWQEQQPQPQINNDVKPPQSQPQPQAQSDPATQQINPANPADPNLHNLCLQNPGDPMCFQHYQLYKQQYQQGQFPFGNQPYFQHLNQIYGGGVQPQPQPQVNYLNPLNDPKINPLADPKINPMMDPKINPLADPRVNPLADPNLNPGCIPCQYGGQQVPGQQQIPGQGQGIPGFGSGQWGGGF